MHVESNNFIQITDKKNLKHSEIITEEWNENITPKFPLFQCALFFLIITIFFNLHSIFPKKEKTIGNTF